MVKILEGKPTGKGKKIAIVVSRFNPFITKRLLEGCLKELVGLGVREQDVTVAWVPGAFEIPVAALKLARKKTIDAVICLGAVIRGETIHFDLVAEAAARGISQVSLTTQKPVIFEVLATETVEQAYKRSQKNKENKGAQAARNAVEMANLLEQV